MELSLADAAFLTGYSVNHLATEIRRGRLLATSVPFVGFRGHAWLLREEDLRAWQQHRRRRRPQGHQHAMRRSLRDLRRAVEAMR